jgi:hypothetical protein
MTSRIPVEAFPEHLLGVRDLTDTDDLLELILAADGFIERMDSQIIELARDAARYQLLSQMVPYMIAEAVSRGVVTPVEDMVKRYDQVEAYLDSLIDQGLPQ